MSWNGNECNNLLRNQGSEGGVPTFTDVGMALGADDQKDCRGLAIADFDNDGDLDICMNTNPGDHGNPVTIALLRNDIGSRRNSLAFELTGTDSNHNAIGAKVQIELKDASTPQKLLTRHVQCGSGYASQSDLRLLFGLGGHDVAGKITVTWPSGREQVFTNVDANQMVKLVEDQSPQFQPFEMSSQ